MSTSILEIWVYSGTGWGPTTDITGYEVEAIDGPIGKVDKATHDADGSYIVAAIGPWIAVEKVVLPGGVISHVDADEKKVYVNRTKDEIKNAPLYDDNRFDRKYREELALYYGGGGPAYREPVVR
jgi:hypothetical protein